MIKPFIRKLLRWIILIYAVFSVTVFSLWLTRYVNRGAYMLVFVTAMSIGSSITETHKICMREEPHG